jgi:D-aspartate ligase
MCTQKVRQYPRGFGQGSIVKTIPIIPEIRDLSLKLLHSVSYQGPSDTEFKLDYRDNQYKLMEINTRPIVQEWLFTKVGINFSYITYLDLVENIRNPSPAYRKDVYWINNLWETISFFDGLRAGNLNLGKFLEPFWKEKVYVVPIFDDPVHFLIEMYYNGVKIVQRL